MKMGNNRIIILGSNGMLGQMVKSYFTKEGYKIVEFNKRFSESNINSYINELNCFENSIVINCIGRIKQKSDDAFNLLLVNSIFPLALAQSLKPSHTLIHPSTDCIFDGNSKSAYSVFSTHTANDIYGCSKSLGEKAISSRHNSLIIRVSIIGPDKFSNKGLLSWFLSNPEGSIINGFTNHFWNGITTLEWCKRLHEIIRTPEVLNKLLEKGLIQLGTEKTSSKYEMLCMFVRIFNRNIEVNPTESIYTNRSLKSEIISEPLEVQLSEISSLKES